MGACRISVFCITLISIIIILQSNYIKCLEKTLRKIVRNQSKMIQKPFSETSKELWDIAAKSPKPLLANNPTLTRHKTLWHLKSKTKISSVLSPIRPQIFDARLVDSKGGREYIITKEDRPSRGTEIDNVSDSQSLQGSMFSPKYESNFLSIDQMKVNSDVNTFNDNSTITNKPMFQSFIVAESSSTISTTYDNIDILKNNEIDYCIEESVAIPNDTYEFYLTPNTYTCATLFQQTADINVQVKFEEFDIEPPWISQKHFWSKAFDARYEALMRNPKWPPLKVILIPHSQVDSIWKKPFEAYHKNVISKILTNVVKKLQFYSNLTFTWNEVSHLSYWWQRTTNKNRIIFRRLLKEGRIEITYGGWVESDEATTHLFGLVHQLIEGQQWLKENLNYTPQVAWFTDSVTHSPTLPYLLASSGISYLILTNLHYTWERWLAEYQHSDFLWIQNWQNDEKEGGSSLYNQLNRVGLPKHAVLTHYLQFNSAGSAACGPNSLTCANYDFASHVENEFKIQSYNVKDKAELLLEQYSKSGTMSQHNVIVAPIGGPDSYQFQDAFDYQYNNYQKLAEFVNINRDIYKATIEFGVPKTFFNSIVKRYNSFPTIKGDFMNFADISKGIPTYRTEYVTAQPFYKILLRRLQSTLRSTEILFSFAINFNAFSEMNLTYLLEMLVNARESTARLMGRHAFSGTLSRSTLKYAYGEISKTIKTCWFIQEYSISYLSIKKSLLQNVTSNLHKYVYRDGEIISNVRKIIPNDRIYVFNTVSYERIEVVEFVSEYPNVQVLNHNKKKIKTQINPIWTFRSDNAIEISKTLYRINFVVVLPPMAIELFQIRKSNNITKNAAVLYCVHCISENRSKIGRVEENFYPFKVQPIKQGDIQLESYELRVIFDDCTGFVKTVVDKKLNITRNVIINYNAFKTSTTNTGEVLFTKEMYDILKPYKLNSQSKVMYMIIVGDITIELISIYGKLLQQKNKIYNLAHNPLSKAIYIETKVNYELFPQNQDLEMFLSIQTDISNGNPPQIITDNNSFLYTLRRLNMSRPIVSNLYPITSTAYIEDNTNRLTIITDHAQGVTALQEGQILVMLDRKEYFNDSLGNKERFPKSQTTVHRHFLLLENFYQQYRTIGVQDENILTLPSFSAHYLSNSLDYPLDMFVLYKNLTCDCCHGFLTLIKKPLPCDISVLNFRIMIRKGFYQTRPNVAIMILHRKSFSCKLDFLPHFYCDRITSFSLNEILHRVRLNYRTRLSGTDKGFIADSYNMDNFPSMELMTLRVQFYRYK